MKAAGSPSSGQTMRPQKPVSPVQAGQTALTPKEAVVADIMASVGRKPPTPCCERDTGFDIMAQAKAQARERPQTLCCSRPCNEFKTGKPCVHIAGGKRCNWGHSLDRFQPKKCAWPNTCNKFEKRQGACECAHVVGGELETPLQVQERLLKCGSMVKAMPATYTAPNTRKKSGSVVSAVQPGMSADEKRAATQKHREQLVALNKAKETPSQPQRRAMVDQRPLVGKAPAKAWGGNRPNKPAVVTSRTASPASSEASSPKPVLKCTPAMAIEMLQQMAKAGIAADTVVIEIVGGN